MNDEILFFFYFKYFIAQIEIFRILTMNFTVNLRLSSTYVSYNATKFHPSNIIFSES